MGQSCIKSQTAGINGLDTLTTGTQSSLTNADSTYINLLLNKLHNNEVEMLTQIFTYHCRQNQDSSIKTYNAFITDTNSLISLFPLLQLEYFKEIHRRNIFNIFDYNKKGCVDLRDFCRMYVISTRGTKSEMMEFLFNTFSDPGEPSAEILSIEHERISIESHNNIGRKSSNIRQTHPTVAVSTDQGKSLESSGADLKRERLIASEDLNSLLCLVFEKNPVKLNKARDVGCPSCPMNLSQFCDFLPRHLDDNALLGVLSIFDLLPKAQEERSIVMKAIEEGTTTLLPGQLVYALNERWWNSWCLHIGVAEDITAMIFDSDRANDGYAMKLILSVKIIHSSIGLHPRPDEIDNSMLQDVYDLTAFNPNALNENIVFISASSWFALTGIYGGGPEFPRRVRGISDRKITPVTTARANAERIEYHDDIKIRIEDMPTTSEKVFDVDLFPNVLQGYWCAASGHPCSFNQKALVSKGGDARELIKWALKDIGVFDAEHGPSLLVSDINLWILKDAQQQQEIEVKRSRQSIESMRSVDMPHFGSVKSSRSMSQDMASSDTLSTLRGRVGSWRNDNEDDGRATLSLSAGTAVAADSEDLLLTGRDKEFTSSRWLRHGPETYWHLVEGEFRGAPLERLGVTSGAMVMFESKCAPPADQEGSVDSAEQAQEREEERRTDTHWLWPVDRVIEPENFRELRLYEYVDVLNYKGKWCVAQVYKFITNETTKGHGKDRSGPQKANDAIGNPLGDDQQMMSAPTSTKGSRKGPVLVRFRFFKTSSKCDEDIESTSHRIAPLGSWTFAVIDDDRDGTSNCVLPRLLLTDVLSKKCEYFNLIKSQQAKLNSYNDGKNVDSSVSLSLSAARNIKPSTVSPSVGIARTESHLVVRRRTSFVHHQSTVLRHLQSALLAAVEMQDAPTRPAPIAEVSVDGTASNNSSLHSTFAMPFTVLKGLVVPSKTSESSFYGGSGTADTKAGNSVRNEALSGDGCVGLANLGNTCYMSSALQCLSHTPLLRHFFLSGRYQSEVNRSNVLGTGGVIAQEFAYLLKMLWSSKGHVGPTRFKKALGKIKVQFSGNDQNDSQEFLAELLDMLHEDLNRVPEKKYIEAPSDETLEKMTLAAQAEDAWKRHIARNRSVLVDLFQGQLCSRIACPACPKVSRTYDPFMFLSVPLLPKQHECNVFVTVIRRMVIQRINGTSAIDETSALESYKNNRSPARYCITLLRLGDVHDLKAAVHKLTLIPLQHMVVVVAKGRRVIRNVSDGDSLVEISELGGNKCIVYEAYKDMPFLSTVTISRFNNRRALIKSEPILSAENVGSENYTDKDEYDLGHSTWEGDIIVDIGTSKDEDHTAYWEPGSVDEDEVAQLFWPDKLSDLKLGMRVDAMDMRGQWFAGCVEEIRLFSLSNNGESSGIPPSTEYYARIHFDNFSSLWDEWISEEDFSKGKLTRIYTHTERKIKLLEVSIIHRRFSKDPYAPPNSLELFGSPFILQCESVRSCKYALRLIEEQATRYMTKDELLKYIQSSKRSSTVSDLPFTVKILSHLRPLVQGHELEDMKRNGDPSLTKKSHQHETTTQQEWEGSLFSGSPDRPLCNIHHPRLLIAVDWTDPEEKDVNRDIAYSDHDGYVNAVMEINNIESAKRADGSHVLKAPDAFANILNFSSNESVDLHDCLRAFTNPEILDEETWYCSSCRTHRRGRMQTNLYRLPDILVIHIKRFSMTARRREKIRSKVIFPLVSLNMASYMSAESGDNGSSSLYDLFAVTNHIGDMSRGHYTSFVNCQVDKIDDAKSSSSFENIETSQSFEPSSAYTSKGRWFLFDDELVEEVPANRVVSGGAYVLFYKRRKLTPSNIINLTA